MRKLWSTAEFETDNAAFPTAVTPNKCIMQNVNNFEDDSARHWQNEG